MTGSSELSAQLNAVIEDLEDSNRECTRVDQVHQGAAYLGERVLAHLDEVDDKAVNGVVEDVKTGNEIAVGAEETLTEGLSIMDTVLGNLQAAMDHFSSARSFGARVKQPLGKADEFMSAWRLSAEDLNRRAVSAARTAEGARRHLQGDGNESDLSKSTTGQLVDELVSKTVTYRDEVISKAAPVIRDDENRLARTTVGFAANLQAVGQQQGTLDSIQIRVREAQKILEGCFDDLKAVNSESATSARVDTLSACQQTITAVKANGKDTLSFLRNNDQLPNEMMGLVQQANSEAEQARENL